MDAVQYKCPNCGAYLNFQPDTQSFGCDFCQSTFTSEQIKEITELAEKDVTDGEEAEKEQDFRDHTNLYTCSSCGAEIIADDQQTATFCYYCHNPVILSGKLTGEYRPSSVIAFRLTRDEALEKFREWCKDRKFLPRDFTSDSQLEKMTGLYVPFWVADCNIKADYYATGNVALSWVAGDCNYTEVKEYNVVRCADILVDGIPADGESKIDDALMESIEPYDYDEMKPFEMSYLSGFFADKYDVDKGAVFPRIRDRAEQAARSVIKESMSSYTSVNVTSERYDITETKWEYTLLPVWFMTYKYRDKIYSFAINGQTGKLAGTPPLDRNKLLLFSLAVCLAVTAVAYFLGRLLF